MKHRGVAVHGVKWGASADARLRQWPNAEGNIFSNHGISIQGGWPTFSQISRKAAVHSLTPTTTLPSASIPGHIRRVWNTVVSSLFMKREFIPFPMGTWGCFPPGKERCTGFTPDDSGILATVGVGAQLLWGPLKQREQRAWGMAARGGSEQHSWDSYWGKYTAVSRAFPWRAGISEFTFMAMPLSPYCS